MGGAIISVSTCSRWSLAAVSQDITMFRTEMLLGWTKPYPRSPSVLGLDSTCTPVRAPHSGHHAVKWAVCLHLRGLINETHLEETISGSGLVTWYLKSPVLQAPTMGWNYQAGTTVSCICKIMKGTQTSRLPPNFSIRHYDPQLPGL